MGGIGKFVLRFADTSVGLLRYLSIITALAGSNGYFYKK